MILNIETATQICSVCLSEGSEIIALKQSEEKNLHASLLSVFIQELFEQTNCKRSDLKAVAVSQGPGSYTGLRIGVSTAKGIAYGLDIPLIGISTLQSMAYGAASKFDNQYSLFAPMIDARRMEVYSAFYNTQNQLIKPISADVITPDSYLEFLNQNKILFFGDGAEKCKEILTHSNAFFSDLFYPSSAFMADLSHEKFVNQQFENVAYFEPFYLKDFIAIKSKSFFEKNK
jgi:tRNA threonylcarbamoyladenosine biosynthesis protein TsaB